MDRTTRLNSRLATATRMQRPNKVPWIPVDHPTQNSHPQWGHLGKLNCGTEGPGFVSWNARWLVDTHSVQNVLKKQRIRRWLDAGEVFFSKKHIGKLRIGPSGKPSSLPPPSLPRKPSTGRGEWQSLYLQLWKSSMNSPWFRICHTGGIQIRRTANPGAVMDTPWAKGRSHDTDLTGIARPRLSPFRRQRPQLPRPCANPG